jgi:hypothetical protein
VIHRRPSVAGTAVLAVGPAVRREIWQAYSVDLDKLLKAMDMASANLAKLENVWNRAFPFVPRGPMRGSHPEYDNLRRAWKDLLPGLPPIDGWTITDELPDMDGLGQSFIDYLDIGEPPFAAYEAGEKPGKDLAEYRYRLDRARRRAARERLQELTAIIDGALARLLPAVPRDSQEKLSGADVDQVNDAVKEIERLLGSSAIRQGRWNDLHGLGKAMTGTTSRRATGPVSASTWRPPRTRMPTRFRYPILTSAWLLPGS